MAKVIVTMPDNFLKQVDGVAQSEQRTRSELIREALRHYLAEKSASIGFEAKTKAALNTMAEARQRSRGKGVRGSDFVHRWRYRLEE